MSVEQCTGPSGGGNPDSSSATEGYGLVGGIGEYEGAWRMAYVLGQLSPVFAALPGPSR